MVSVYLNHNVQLSYVLRWRSIPLTPVGVANSSLCHGEVSAGQLQSTHETPHQGQYSNARCWASAWA